MTQLETLFSKYNFPKRDNSTVTTIKEIESIINFTLPDDFIFFASNYQGFEDLIGQHYVRLWDIDEIISSNRNYQIFDNLPKTLGIGGNGGSEFIALEQTSNNLRVVLSPFIDLDPQYHIEIGNSFTDFLVRLDEGHEWFQ